MIDWCKGNFSRRPNKCHGPGNGRRCEILTDTEFGPANGPDGRQTTIRNASICDRLNNFIRDMPGDHHEPNLQRDREPLPRNQPILRYTLHKETILYEQQNSYQRR
jgi:hypothetical protein